jgi:hypothetical protein
MKLLWLCAAGMFSVKYFVPTFSGTSIGTFHILFILVHLNMKVAINESFVEDIDAISWVLRDPGGECHFEF